MTTSRMRSTFSHRLRFAAAALVPVALVVATAACGGKTQATSVSELSNNFNQESTDPSGTDDPLLEPSDSASPEDSQASSNSPSSAASSTGSSSASPSPSTANRRKQLDPPIERSSSPRSNRPEPNRPAAGGSILYRAANPGGGTVNEGSVANGWQVTSGDMSARGGAYYSNSEVFRTNTQRNDFRNVAVSFDLKIDGQNGSSQTWDGIHIFLRHVSQYHLYYASVDRRDGKVVIKKKCPGGPDNGGTYYELGSEGGHPIPFGQWHAVSASVKDAGGEVQISLQRNGQTLLTATDNGDGHKCEPIRQGGHTGIRGDNTSFSFRNFVVRPA